MTATMVAGFVITMAEKSAGIVEVALPSKLLRYSRILVDVQSAADVTMTATVDADFVAMMAEKLD